MICVQLQLTSRIARCAHGQGLKFLAGAPGVLYCFSANDHGLLVAWQPTKFGLTPPRISCPPFDFALTKTIERLFETWRIAS